MERCDPHSETGATRGLDRKWATMHGTAACSTPCSCVAHLPAPMAVSPVSSAWASPCAQVGWFGPIFRHTCVFPLNLCPGNEPPQVVTRHGQIQRVVFCCVSWYNYWSPKLVPLCVLLQKKRGGGGGGRLKRGDLAPSGHTGHQWPGWVASSHWAASHLQGGPGSHQLTKTAHCL